MAIEKQLSKDWPLLNSTLGGCIKKAQVCQKTLQKHLNGYRKAAEQEDLHLLNSILKNLKRNKESLDSL